MKSKSEMPLNKTIDPMETRRKRLSAEDIPDEKRDFSFEHSGMPIRCKYVGSSSDNVHSTERFEWFDVIRPDTSIGDYFIGNIGIPCKSNIGNSYRAHKDLQISYKDVLDICLERLGWKS